MDVTFKGNPTLPSLMKTLNVADFQRDPVQKSQSLLETASSLNMSLRFGNRIPNNRVLLKFSVMNLLEREKKTQTKTHEVGLQPAVKARIMWKQFFRNGSKLAKLEKGTRGMGGLWNFMSFFLCLNSTLSFLLISSELKVQCLLKWPATSCLQHRWSSL